MEVNTSSTIDNQNMYSYINNFVRYPLVFIVLIVVILAYGIFFVSLGDNTATNPSTNTSTNTSTNNEDSIGSTLLIIIIVIVLIILASINIFKYFFGIDIVAKIPFFSSGPTVDIQIKQTDKVNIAPITLPEIPVSKLFKSEEVFNVPNNKYTYDEAKTVCAAYNSRLATYDEVEDAYNDGGEWCNYGWSDKQLALFPTQKDTYNKLQQIPKHEHDCGRSGVNGGYIANPNAKFGINCFGKKPKMTKEEEELMQASTLYPKTEADILLEKQAEDWKHKLDKILVSPFNHNQWNN